MHLQLDEPLMGMHESAIGWLGLAPASAGGHGGTLSWIDREAVVLHTMTLPPLYDMVDEGPTWYGPLTE